MMSWLLENPARFLHEQKELKRLESEHEWLNMALRFQSDGKLSVEINMTIHGRIYEGKMTYPDSFQILHPIFVPETVPKGGQTTNMVKGVTVSAMAS